VVSLPGIFSAQIKPGIKDKLGIIIFSTANCGEGYLDFRFRSSLCFLLKKLTTKITISEREEEFYLKYLQHWIS
jgi:hypothetical protein